MNARLLAGAAIAGAISVWSASAIGVTCYVVMDRNDNVTYRSTLPPIDLSDAGAAARERMRQRGEYLMFGEFDTCPGVTFFTGAGGSKALELDQVVNGMPALPMNGGVSPARGNTGGAVASPRGSSGSQRPASTPAAKRSSGRY